MDKKIYIVGLGAGSVDALTLQAYRILKAGYPLYLRTERHPAVELLREENIVYQSFDSVYDQADNFDEVYEGIVNQLLMHAEKHEQPIIYAVPGHPMVAERSVKQLREKAVERHIAIEMISSSSFLDDMFSVLNIDPNEGFILLDGLSFNETMLDSRMHVFITQVYSTEVASEVKLTLSGYYPEETVVKVIRAAGVKDQQCIWEVPLYEIDRLSEIDHLTAIYIPCSAESTQRRSFGRLVEIVKQLRGPEGCPWDIAQTHESLREYLIEETYEVIDAIDNDDIDNLLEELGDILLQVVLHAQIGSDQGEFSIYEIVQAISDKMVRRHPHVFQKASASNAEQVVELWDEIKKQEKGHHDTEGDHSVIAGIPQSLPALMYAYKQQKKLASVGFDWDSTAPIWDKLHEEIHELQNAEDQQGMDEELGDVLYAIVNLARKIHVQPEIALRQTCQKVEQRFHYIEQRLREEGLTFADVDLPWMDEQWNLAKKCKK